MQRKIYWAGDSTVKTNDYATYPQTGIGQTLSLFVCKDVLIENHAENGRSTKSFIDEARLATIYNELREGDFLFIQFGHNDAKKEDETRFTEPFGEYQVNLEKFVNVARNRNAIPLFITPVCRRWYEADGTLQKGIHGDYPNAMKAVAERLNVPLIDLYESSKRLIKEWGMEGSIQHFMNLPKNVYSNYPNGLEDNTHLTYSGAVAFSKILAKGLKKLGGEYAELLNKPEIL